MNAGARMHALIDAATTWVAALPTDAVKVSFPPIPSDDDYGLERIVACEPLKLGACPLEVGITGSAGGREPSAYVFLDTWRAIARRAHLHVAAHAAERIALYREPMVISPVRLLEIGDAVAAGRVQLEIGAWNAKLAWTSGSLQLRDERLAMRGSGTRPPLASLLSSLGLVRVTHVEYAPWI